MAKYLDFAGLSTFWSNVKSWLSSNLKTVNGESLIGSGDITISSGSSDSSDTSYAGSGGSSVAMGYYNTASGFGSVAMGNSNTVSGDSSVAMGYYNTASGFGSVAMGNSNTVSGDSSVAMGYYNTASGFGSVAMGGNSIASGGYSVAMGYISEASGFGSVAMGGNSIASGGYSVAMGQCNYTDSDNTDSYYVTVGNGSNSARANIFRITTGGDVYAAGSFNASSADYAEMFEWSDGNPDGEDRVGRFVTLDGENIAYADADSTYILGIVSANPVIIGDNPIEWSDKYLTDEWGRFVYEDIEETIEIPTGKKDDDGNVIKETQTITRTVRKVNPDYDASQSYLERSKRPEWAAIGMLGKLFVRQDGTLTAGGYCKPSTDGVATASDTAGYYVMSIISDDIALVLSK